MSKSVQLVFARNYRSFISSADTESVIVEVPDYFKEGFHLIAASVSQPQGSEGPSTDPRMGDIPALMVTYDDGRTLEGKLLTYIDATFTDPEQRKAHKDIIRQTLHEHNESIRTRAYQTLEATKERADVLSK